MCRGDQHILILVKLTPESHVIAHTFCASGDRFPMGGAYSEYKDIFARFKTMRRKQNLACASGCPKRKLGVTTHFSEIIKLQFGKKRKKEKTPYNALYFTLCCFIISKKKKKRPGYPQFSFWISTALTKICFPRIVINCAKKHPY